jgi:Domain of unknown function (DUF4436)
VLEMDRPGPRRRIMRFLAVGIAILLLMAAYILALSRFHAFEVPGEKQFGAAEIESAGEVYFEPISIDAPNDALQMRVYVMPRSSSGGDAQASLGRDLTVLITHDKTVEEVMLAAGQHVATSTFEVDLNEGSVTRYPFDSYVSELAVDVMDAKTSQKIPVQVTVWEGVRGYRLQATAEPAADPSHVGIIIGIRRSGAPVLFALCAYGAIVVLGLSALAIGVLVFAEERQTDTTLIAALAAVAFALPALRNALPGSPPLGIEADIWVFLWAELAVVLGFALLVFQWARTEYRP